MMQPARAYVPPQRPQLLGDDETAAADRMHSLTAAHFPDPKSVAGYSPRELRKPGASNRPSAVWSCLVASWPYHFGVTPGYLPALVWAPKEEIELLVQPLASSSTSSSVLICVAGPMADIIRHVISDLENSELYPRTRGSPRLLRICVSNPTVLRN